MYAWLVTVCLTLGLIHGPAAHADALFTGAAPTIDGVIGVGERGFAQTEFDSGPRPYDGSATGWDLSGAVGTFGWDATNVYELIEADATAPGRWYVSVTQEHSEA